MINYTVKNLEDKLYGHKNVNQEMKCIASKDWRYLDCQS